VVDGLTTDEQLVRASMMIRGIRPSVADFDRIEDDPDALEALVDTYLQSPEFGLTIRDLHAERYLLRTDTTFQLPVYGILAERGYDQGDVYDSTTEAPLRQIEDIVMSDRPYTEVVTAQYTLANRVVADIYGLPFDPAGPEWQQTHWVDGRPQAGILSDSELWRRHVSNAKNFHRRRANFVSDTFLCANVGGREVKIEGSVSIDDPFAVSAAVSSNPTCVACHSTLDPLAAFFWGYKEQLKRGAINQAYDLDCSWDMSDGTPVFGTDELRASYRIDHWCYPLQFYVVSDEDLWSYYGLRQPGYFGAPATSMTDVGEHIAGDPRFAQCTARTFYGFMTQMKREEVPLSVASDLQDVFVESGFSARALVKAIALRPELSVARISGDTEATAPPLQAIRPEQYTRMVEDLTGFAWLADQDTPSCESGGNSCWGAVDLARSDLFGYRAMMGGIDAWMVIYPTHTTTPTKTLAMGKMADEAAAFVVERDLSLPVADRRLLVLADDIDAQIAWLHLRISGERVHADSEEVARTRDLFDAVADRLGTDEAWRVVISALLQDVRVLYY